MQNLRLFTIIIISIIILSCSNSTNKRKVFTIVHMNDTHSKDKEFVVVSKEDGSTNRYGGAARRKTFIDNIRKTNENVIVMHAGDTISGSVFSIIYQGMDEVELMNDIGVQVAALGNHEFDFGIDQLYKVVSNRNFPTISCNVKLISTGENCVLPYMITNVNGIHVAIIGVLREKTNTVKGEDYVYAENEIESLKNLLETTPINTTNDITILLSHAGYEVDKRIAKEIPNTFNIIIGGHSHTLLKEPTIINNTTIVQAGQYGEYTENFTFCQKKYLK